MTNIQTKLINGIKALPEYTAKDSYFDDTVFGLNIKTSEQFSGQRKYNEYVEVAIVEEYAGLPVIKNIVAHVEGEITYRKKPITLTEALNKIQVAMQRFAGVPVDGIYLRKE
ncbi:hypothetical protein MPH47_13985 [Psychrobacillus psychrodurans]|uniref:hypothetical protein n=1 Tax=Psychrobacillus psychrodurans TaxID=126157 RepID=UPI001F4E46CC|nr:hypothetical protein [Psychrobacillus psychrodurans]MCK1998310.1 hypothetical protein [Psychrobacillus psychrodurans]